MEVISERVQAEALASALRDQGLVVMVLKKGAHQNHPCLIVATNRPTNHRLTETIYLAPEDGQWWFWWGEPLDRICLIDQVEVAVVEIGANLVPRLRVVRDRTGYSRAYMREWKQRRRDKLIELLGGVCVRCGSTEDLEFDHTDPSTKAFDIAGVLSRAWGVLVEEAAKCQLLCKPCHVGKGAEDRPSLQHGTLYVYSYWRCRCAPCKAANARKSAADRARKAAAPTMPPARVEGRSRSDYRKAWRQGRRTQLVEMLGGKCVRCGAEDDLEFDHIDPSTKVFVVGANLDRPWADLMEEAAKCQILCKECHVAKGAEDRAPLRHGTYYVYWYWNCRCDLCRAANNRKSAALAAKKT